MQISPRKRSTAQYLHIWITVLENQKQKTEILTSTDEKSVSEPWLEETIFGRFIDVYVTAEQKFHIAWINQEDN